MLSPLETEVALRVVPVDSVRGDADDDPYLTATERVVLLSASDEEIAAAISGAWRQVEDGFYAIHDELQAAAKDAVFAGRAVEGGERGRGNVGG